MFDVSWSTPTETVAAHRSRKSQNSSSSSSQPGKRASLMSSTSSGSSTKPSSRGIPGLGTFKSDNKQKERDKGGRKEYKTTKDESAKEHLDKRLSSATDTTEDSENEDLEQQSEYGGEGRDSTVTDQSQSSQSSSSLSSILLECLHWTHANMPADSISSTYLSPWSTASSCYSHPLDITAEHEFQPLSPKSFVIRSTEVTITSKDVAASLRKPMREVHILSDAPNDFVLDLDVDDSPTDM